MEVQEHENDGNESMSEEEEDSSSDYDSSSVDSGYGNLLENALFPPARVEPVDTRTPLERWQEYLDKIRRRQTKVLKFVDPQLEIELSILRTFDTENENNTELGQQSWKAELLEVVTTAAVDPENATVSGYLTHAIIGREMLRLLGADWQQQLFLAIASHATLAYLELQSISYSARPSTVPIWDSRPSVLSMPALIEALVAYPTPALSEIELLGVKFPSIHSVHQLATVLEHRRTSLRQVNIVGIEPPTPDEAAPKLSVGWLDPILLSLAARSSVDATGGTPLDELKLVMRQPSLYHGARNDTLTAITSQALSTLLQHKKKWWRLSLDGLGLGDDHLHVVTTMFRRDDTCKAGDLLCLERNPNITSRAYQEFFEGCFFWKRRMGLVKVDDKDWERQFDLVRSMNNLHNRLDYVVSTGSTASGSTKALEQQQSSSKCSFASRDKWVDWLVKLGTGLAWEDDKHRINYLWFTLLEKPEFIYSHA